MRNPFQLTARQWLVVCHDLLATAAALFLTFYMRFEGDAFVRRLDSLLTALPAFVLYAGFIYFLFGLYKAKWRFASLPDLLNIVRAVTVITLSLLAVDYILVSPNVLNAFYFGKITLLLYWFVQIFFLAGPRVLYRSFRYAHTQQQAKVEGTNLALIVGRAADSEVLLRAIESGAVTKIWPAGVLSPSSADRGQTIRGIAVLGGLEDAQQVLEQFEAQGRKITRLILTTSAFETAAKTEQLFVQARRHGIAVSRLPSLDGDGIKAQLAPVAVEDLLLRPSVEIDYRRLDDFVRGKSVVVTGGGGSIGGELCQRVAAFGAKRLLVIENSEPALHAILEALAARDPKTVIEGRIGDIRDRARIQGLFEAFRPEIVFHAAALKHVPLLERDWDEGIKTNVFGSVNVADAARAAGALAMVMISTDKAIEPVSVLGATKRLAEMYCQALDTDFAKSGDKSMRLISVRFGNVLASNGSVVPKFKAQIEAGGPITVTHPDMVRYFMTIREACDLVVTAASHAMAAKSGGTSVYVLNMGQPVRIVDLAENMIRLSGLEPGRDIEITFTGVRPGERLNEILFAREESSSEIGIPGIVGAKPIQPSLETMRAWLKTLDDALQTNDRSGIYRVLHEAVPDFNAKVA